MVNIRRFLASVLILMFLCSGAKASNIVKVIDNAGLFSSSELEDLNKRAEEMSKKYDMDIGIATTNSANGMSTMEYSDYFYENHGFGSNGSGVFVMYDMDNREIFIITEGRGKDKINDSKVQKLLDAVFDNGLKEGKYYNSAIAYLNKLNGYLRGNYLSPMDMGISALGALGAGGGFFGAVKSKYKVKTNPHIFNYRKNVIVNFAPHGDRLLDTRVVTRKIPRNTGGGGKGGGGTTTRSSSTGSGRTYGGGGRKF